MAEVPLRRVEAAGVGRETLVVPPDLQASPLYVSFEQAAKVLEAMPRLHFEPDGSFVWVSGTHDVEPWQVDGNLYDRDESLVAIDLKGTCTRGQLSQLLDVFRSEGRELMIEIVRDAVFVRETHFIESF